ncbi:MAG: ParB/RepB/Spo0J family partition protein [Solirubrobacterales bacterium]|nr:ParB/RepB/Spo0J family partition protein [Solirubrobacterales bacterium]
MAERRGLGKGLGAILPESATGPDMRELPVKSIDRNPEQPRTNFSEQALEALSESIKASGVVQPLIVRPAGKGRYEIIAGERRWRAAQMAGVEKVPVVIRDSDEADRLEVALIENMVRENLNPVEEAKACAALVEDLGLSKEELGKRVGRSRPQISNLIRLLDLPDDVLEMLEQGDLSEGHGRAILQVPDHGDRRKLARQAKNEGWSVRQTEAGARAMAESPKKGRGRIALSAEETEAIAAATEQLETGLDRPVRIRPKGKGLVVEIELDDLGQAIEIADRLT